MAAALAKLAGAGKCSGDLRLSAVTALAADTCSRMVSGALLPPLQVQVLPLSTYAALAVCLLLCVLFCLMLATSLSVSFCCSLIDNGAALCANSYNKVDSIWSEERHKRAAAGTGQTFRWLVSCSEMRATRSEFMAAQF